MTSELGIFKSIIVCFFLDSNQVVNGDKIEHLACDRYDYTRKKFRESWETKKDKDISAFVFYTEDGTDPKECSKSRLVFRYITKLFHFFNLL